MLFLLNYKFVFAIFGFYFGYSISRRFIFNHVIESIEYFNKAIKYQEDINITLIKTIKNLSNHIKNLEEINYENECYLDVLDNKIMELKFLFQSSSYKRKVFSIKNK
jgi:hypothetical protein